MATKKQTPTSEAKPTQLDNAVGYNPNFLEHEIPLPKAQTPPDAILHYKHFSVAMNAKRRMTQYTAVNIDAVKYNALKEHIPTRKEIGADDWVPDERFDPKGQLPKSFFVDNPFDLGHMVRREDPLWGDTLEEALEANEHTFFLTNATPQHEKFNRNAKKWKGLEDYALKNARANKLLLTVFSGCIFTNDDRHLGEVQIPGKFFKVIVMRKKNDELSATGYIVRQDGLIKKATTRGIEAKNEFVFSKFKTYQVPLKEIEEATGLEFGLNAHDPLQKPGTRSIFGEEVANQPIAITNMKAILF